MNRRYSLILLLFVSLFAITGCNPSSSDNPFGDVDNLENPWEGDGDDEGNESDRSACPAIAMQCPENTDCMVYDASTGEPPECEVSCIGVAEPDGSDCSVGELNGSCKLGACVVFGDADGDDTGIDSCPDDPSPVTCPEDTDCMAFRLRRAAYPDCMYYCESLALNEHEYCSVGGLPGYCSLGQCIPWNDGDDDFVVDGDLDLESESDLEQDDLIDGDETESESDAPFLVELPASIPDGVPTGIANVIHIEGEDRGTVQGVCVLVDIEHEYNGDLIVTLYTPQGSEFRIFNQQGNGPDLLLDFRSDRFDGENAAGDWMLVVADLVAQDSGVWLSWSIDPFCDVPDGDIPDGDASDGDVPDGDIPDGDVTDGDVTDGDVPDGDVPDGDVPDGDIPDGDVPDGDIPDGDASDGDVPDGDIPDGDVTDGDVTDGDVPDGDVPDGDVPDGDIPDGDVPDGDVTDGDVPDGDVPDGDVPDGDVSDGDVPDGDVPDGDVPDGDVPDGDVPDGDVPDGDVPDGDVSDGDVPDGDVPDGDVPDGDVPDGDVPDGDIPDGDVPDGDVSDGDVPDGDVPDGDVPDGDVSDGDVPDGDVPDGDVPDGDVPDGDIPDGDIPDGDVPDGDVPDGDVPDGDVPDGDVTDGDAELYCTCSSNNDCPMGYYCEMYPGTESCGIGCFILPPDGDLF